MMHLVPIPQKIIPLKGTFELAEPIALSSDFEISPRLQSTLETFPSIELESSKSNSTSVRLKKTAVKPVEESYSLSIGPEGVEIEAGTDSGFYRGLTTLSQIVQIKGQLLHCIQIEDKPDLKVRGYMLDISRCKVPTQESLFQLVDTLASLKFNQLQFYTEHTFAYQNHQNVWRDASPLTAEEIQALDTYCYNRFIELVPNQNSFGHMDRWLRHDNYKHLAECPDGYEHPISGPLPWGGTLKPDQASLDFVSELYDELLPNFRSKLFNIGGDEPWELGQGWSRDIVKAKGKHRVYLDHLLSIHKQVTARDKTMQFWGDIILESPDLAKELPKDAIGVIWGYEADHPFAEQCASFQDSGIPFYVAPGTSAWNTIGGRQKNAIANVQTATEQAIRFGAQGTLLTDWGDFGHHHFPPISYPAIVWAATLSWNRSSESEFDDIQAISTVFFEDTSLDLAKAIFSLSNLINDFSYQPINRTLLNDLLFTSGEKFQHNLSKANQEELEDCRSGLLKLLEQLGCSNDPFGNAKFAEEELILSCQLLCFTVDKGLSRLNETSTDRRNLDTELQSLIKAYREQWLRRNRPGGLDESASYLEKSLKGSGRSPSGH